MMCSDYGKNSSQLICLLLYSKDCSLRGCCSINWMWQDYQLYELVHGASKKLPACESRVCYGNLYECASTNGRTTIPFLIKILSVTIKR